MSLSCSCNYVDGDWWYEGPDDFTTLTTKRRKRCCSCKELIDVESECVRFDRYRDPNSEIEENIYGTSVYMAAWYMCETCGEIYCNLTELGYCIYLGDSMTESLKEYHEMTGFKTP